MNLNKKNTLTLINWLVAFSLLLLFLTWNGAFEGKLTKQEIDFYKQKIPQTNPSLNTDQINQFLETDDGKPIVVANFVKFYDNPQTTKKEYIGKTNEEIVQPYSDYWLSFVLPRGSYPIYVGKPIIEAFESRGVENADKWTDVILVRYKNRRIFAQMITDQGFNQFHDLKYITTEKSIALPTSPFLQFVKFEYFIMLLLLSISLSIQLLINSKCKEH